MTFADHLNFMLERLMQDKNVFLKEPKLVTEVLCLIVSHRLTKNHAARWVPPREFIEGKVKYEVCDLSPFYLRLYSSISIQDYIWRWYDYGEVSSAVLITALVYIDKAIQYHSSLEITTLSAHRLWAVSCILASKFLHEDSPNMYYFARVGGLDMAELNKIERKFLLLIRHECFVSPESLMEAQQRYLREALQILSEQ